MRLDQRAEIHGTDCVRGPGARANST
jgi:hypothetical protein